MDKKIHLCWLRVILFGFFLFLPLESSAKEPVKPTKSSTLSVAESCGNDRCHKRIYKEWSGTMHSRSTPQRNPVVAAFFRYYQENGKDTKTCNLCHAPILALYEGQEEGNKLLFEEGVTCVFCHSVYGHGSMEKKGINYYHLNLNEYGTGPFQEVSFAPHKTEKIDLFRKIFMCLGCHKQGEGAYLLQKGERETTCQTCHMPSKQNVKSSESGKVRKKVYRHLFEGGHSEMILSMSAFIMGTAKRGEGKTLLDLEIENAAYHSLPTGFPLRAIFLKIRGYDKKGNLLWSNFKGEEPPHDPKTFFGLIFKEEDEIYAHYGGGAVPAESHLFDALKIQNLSFDVPSDKVHRFQVELYYRPLPKRVVKKLGLEKGLITDTLMMEESVYVR